MKDGFRIVDTDCHQIEPASMWSEYIDPAFAGREPRMDEVDGRTQLCVEGNGVTPPDAERKYPMNSPEFHEANRKAMMRFSRARDAGFDAASRVLDMDEHGVDMQVIYPTFGGQILGREFEDPELIHAICRAYNDWCADYCSLDPARLRWAAMLPVQAPDLAIDEARRAAEKGCAGYYIRPNPVLGRNLYHEDYWPLWGVIESLDRPVCMHDSGSPWIPSYGDRMDTHTTGHILAHPFEAMSAMAGLIWFGVPEHFPRLRFVHVEADAGWVPYWLQRMEQHYDFSGTAEHPELKRAPTEYFRSNFFVAARGDERTLKAAVELVGEEYFLFNTDYPHADGTFPWGMSSLVEQPISDEAKRKILWDNAVRAFAIAA